MQGPSVCIYICNKSMSASLKKGSCTYHWEMQFLKYEKNRRRSCAFLCYARTRRSASLSAAHRAADVLSCDRSRLRAAETKVSWSRTSIRGASSHVIIILLRELLLRISSDFFITTKIIIKIVLKQKWCDCVTYCDSYNNNNNYIQQLWQV